MVELSQFEHNMWLCFRQCEKARPETKSYKWSTKTLTSCPKDDSSSCGVFCFDGMTFFQVIVLEIKCTVITMPSNYMLLDVQYTMLNYKYMSFENKITI